MSNPKRPDDDPDVPKLRARLRILQMAVAKHQLNPATANHSLGIYADSLREGAPTKRKRARK